MAEKTFINNSLVTLQITILIREGINPKKQEGTLSFKLEPGETETVSYGTVGNDLLNGVLLFNTFEGNYSKGQIVHLANSQLDNLLNTNDVITITKEQTVYTLNGTTHLLNALNNVMTTEDMREALENPGLGLDLTVYKTLSETLKDEVAFDVLGGRTIDGYPTVSSLQDALDAANSDIVNP